MRDFALHLPNVGEKEMQAQRARDQPAGPFGVFRSEPKSCTAMSGSSCSFVYEAVTQYARAVDPFAEKP